MAQRGKELIEIPVLGVHTVNGYRKVKKLIKSIDYPIKNVVIMNNSNDLALQTELDELVKEGSPYVSSMKAVVFYSDKGILFSWDFVTKSFPTEPYWLMSKDDVLFTPGLLSEIAEATKDKELSLTHPNVSEFNVETCDLFAITEKGVREIGLGALSKT